MELKDKIRIGLDEDRMLVLVVQVLIGFDYKAVFEAKFVELPVLLQYLKLFSLAAQLITLMLLLAIPSYHRIAEQGENSAYFCRVIKGLMAIALFPFAFSFGAEFAIPGFKAFGSIGSVGRARMFATVLYHHRIRKPKAVKNDQEDYSDKYGELRPHESLPKHDIKI